MSKFIIEGGTPVNGEITVAGNKNAALPIIAATVLTDQPCEIDNVPDIRDVHAMLAILSDLGKTVQREAPNRYVISGSIRHARPARQLVQKLRASILFLGALLGKTGEALISPPGGCVIGRRHLEPHFEALTGLGAEIQINPDFYHAHLQRTAGGDIFLPEASVTATENALLLTATSPQQTVINNAACEPHVSDLARVLTKMGAKIDGIGTHCLQVCGNTTLSGFTHRVEADYIEAGTFAILAACTGGRLLIREAKHAQMRITEYYLQKLGVRLQFDVKNDTLLVNSGNLSSNNLKIQAGLYPNFPTDLMSPMICLATRAAGTTLCHDWMFESRMFFVDKLIAMGANIILCDPHRVLVSGPTALKGQSLTSPDIRAGIALVIAALSARGSSVIENAELIDRGYENIVERLQQIGASIQRRDEPVMPPLTAAPYSVSAR